MYMHICALYEGMKLQLTKPLKRKKWKSQPWAWHTVHPDGTTTPCSNPRTSFPQIGVTLLILDAMNWTTMHFALCMKLALDSMNWFELVCTGPNNVNKVVQCRFCRRRALTTIPLVPTFMLSNVCRNYCCFQHLAQSKVGWYPKQRHVCVISFFVKVESHYWVWSQTHFIYTKFLTHSVSEWVDLWQASSKNDPSSSVLPLGIGQVGQTNTML